MNINITPKQIDFNKHLVVDIRTKGEQERAYLKNAYSYPIEYDFDDEAKMLDDFRKLKEQDKEIVLMCASGYRSLILCEFLAKNGVSVLNLDGGIIAFGSEYCDMIVQK